MSGSLLPIGTVVKLKDTEKLMMICGFCPTSPAKPGYVYDYSGFPFPEGYMDVLKIYQFDNTQIEKIIALGYQDTEAFHYVAALEKRIDEIKEKVSDTYKNDKEEETSQTESKVSESLSETDYIQ